MKKSLSVSVLALCAGCYALPVMAGPLEPVAPAIDDDIFVYWSEGSEPADPVPGDIDPANTIADNIAIDDDNEDGLRDSDGSPSNDPYRAFSTTRSVDRIVENSGLAREVDDNLFTVYQLGEDLVPVADETGGQTVFEAEKTSASIERMNTTLLPSVVTYMSSDQLTDDVNNLSSVYLGAEPLTDNPLTIIENNFDDPVIPDPPSGDQEFALIDVFTAGNLIEPDTGCEVLTLSINFDFGTDNSTGISAPANVEFLCGAGNPGDTEFRLSTTADDPATDGVDQDAASRYDVVMYNASLPGSQSDAGREKTMKLIDDATGLGVAETTYAVPASGTAESFSLHAELSDAQHGGKPIPRNSADPDNPEAFIMNIYL